MIKEPIILQNKDDKFSHDDLFPPELYRIYFPTTIVRCVYNLTKDEINNLKGKSFNEIMGWIRWTRKRENPHFNKKEMNRWIMENKIPVDLYEVKDDE